MSWKLKEYSIKNYYNCAYKFNEIKKVRLMLQDKTYLEWAVSKTSDGTPGTFLKSYEGNGEDKIYYKLSNYSVAHGVYGHEAINEIVAMNVGKILGMSVLDYTLEHAKINIFGNELEAYFTASKNFRKNSEDKMSFETFYSLNCDNGENVLEFIERMDLKQYFSDMFLLDWLICNRDRHGANIEVLQDNGFRMAPLFDHGLSFMFSCYFGGEAALEFDHLKDTPVNNFVGSRILSENLQYVNESTINRFTQVKFIKENVFRGIPKSAYTFPEYEDCIFNMLERRISYAKKVLIA